MYAATQAVDTPTAVTRSILLAPLAAGPVRPSKHQSSTKGETTQTRNGAISTLAPDQPT